MSFLMSGKKVSFCSLAPSAVSQLLTSYTSNWLPVARSLSLSVYVKLTSAVPLEAADETSWPVLCIYFSVPMGASFCSSSSCSNSSNCSDNNTTTNSNNTRKGNTKTLTSLVTRQVNATISESANFSPRPSVHRTCCLFVCVF